VPQAGHVAGALGRQSFQGVREESSFQEGLWEAGRGGDHWGDHRGGREAGLLEASSWAGEHQAACQHRAASRGEGRGVSSFQGGHVLQAASRGEGHVQAASRGEGL